MLASKNVDTMTREVVRSTDQQSLRNRLAKEFFDQLSILAEMSQANSPGAFDVLRAQKKALSDNSEIPSDETMIPQFEEFRNETWRASKNGAISAHAEVLAFRDLAEGFLRMCTASRIATGFSSRIEPDERIARIERSLAGISLRIRERAPDSVVANGEGRVSCQWCDGMEGAPDALLQWEGAAAVESTRATICDKVAVAEKIRAQNDRTRSWASKPIRLFLTAYESFARYGEFPEHDSRSLAALLVKKLKAQEIDLPEFRIAEGKTGGHSVWFWDRKVKAAKKFQNAANDAFDKAMNLSPDDCISWESKFAGSDSAVGEAFDRAICRLASDDGKTFPNDDQSFDAMLNLLSRGTSQGKSDARTKIDAILGGINVGDFESTSPLSRCVESLIPMLTESKSV